MTQDTAKVGARCPKKMKNRIARAERTTGQSEADFIRAAISEFFQNHKTPEAIMAAVQNYRTQS